MDHSFLYKGRGRIEKELEMKIVPMELKCNIFLRQKHKMAIPLKNTMVYLSIFGNKHFENQNELNSKISEKNIKDKLIKKYINHFFFFNY